jgi:DNA-binding helix-hairpin-helix protein with protein kinase domain
MTVGPGTAVCGVRVNPPHADEWVNYTLGPHIDAGGAGAVYSLTAKTTPQLVAKIYDGSILERVRKEPPLRQRIIVLAQHRDHLMKELPFAFWPRRILFTMQAPDETQIPQTILGFTMAALPNTTSLTSLLSDDSARTRITHADTIHIACTLADQIAKLHRHAWQFVFGDMSPNNIHVTHNFASVYFIDTDAFQFQYNHPHFAFSIPGLTPGFESPGARQVIKAGGSLSTNHDDFVLAIIIFQILMAQSGLTRVHPFSYADSTEVDNINARRFPYANPAAYPVPAMPLAFYRSLPSDIHLAFMQTFTTPTPFPAAQWPPLLSGYRRGLRR